MFLDPDAAPHESRRLAAREVDSLTERVPVPPERLVGALVGLAVVGAATAVIALLVVVALWK